MGKWFWWGKSEYTGGTLAPPGEEKMKFVNLGRQMCEIFR
jgi:hypothetical protein